ncbi:NUDIX domain-containing protein [Paenibacillus nasutitermitis]|uniref:DNA mismatch repair protein MutT n=1 Tax=Paenibacillus nasutitermitis TaxID=1652958 RepID=A0A916ZAE0_9BACL|nr:NUDIX domain-containing protein [Paenibacillus nasutitermitis]GGD83633.1 DNA mismatch repair protein MutT [Paenibacillus nasutitermitis]
MRDVVTGGAIIRDDQGRILLQQRSDYGDWGLPGGGMNPGESIEETMIREVFEETGLSVKEYELYAVYSGSRMEYTYPDGNKVVFVMFLFNASTDYSEHLSEDGDTIRYQDDLCESLKLQFCSIDDISLDQINKVQRPVFEDLLNGKTNILRS